jgi:hypothetical protein
MEPKGARRMAQDYRHWQPTVYTMQLNMNTYADIALSQ